MAFSVFSFFLLNFFRFSSKKIKKKKKKKKVSGAGDPKSIGDCLFEAGVSSRHDLRIVKLDVKFQYIPATAGLE